MRINVAIALLLACAPPVANAVEKPRAAGADAETLWDIAQLGLFDATNKAYTIDSGVVNVDLAGSGPICPTGLGHLASGMDTVKSIRLRFACAAAGEYWLHVRWTPGGSGDEQFSVAVEEKPAGTTRMVSGSEQPNASIADVFRVKLPRGAVTLTLTHLSGDGLRFEQVTLSRSQQPPQMVRPDLKYPTLTAYEEAIGEAGVLLDGAHVMLLAPRSRERAARQVFDRLVPAYDALFEIVGVHTPFKIVVYHFPEGHADARGGTSNCVLWYGYKNLDPDAWTEWRKLKIPHVCGYIEEMAHNFVSASGAQFGWEMIGWSIGVRATEQVAPNSVFKKDVSRTRHGQAETLERYVRGGCVFPKDLPSNQVDRIHARLLYLCERQYGDRFWPDFFTEIRKAEGEIAEARRMSDSDARRNKLYQITLECFDRLKGIEFESLLKEHQISLTTDVKSLRPTDEGWDRRLMAPGERVDN